MGLARMAVGSALAALAIGAPMSETGKAVRTLEDVAALMAQARSSGRTGIARKTKPVDARPARAGEIVISAIAGEGKETQSRPARSGDWVVRNRCPATGNEEYLVGGEKFTDRYHATSVAPGPDGWQEFRLAGKEMRFLFLPPEEGTFTFTAPWGEPMVARPGDAIVQDPHDQEGVYRVAAASFACTYEVLPAADRDRP